MMNCFIDFFTTGDPTALNTKFLHSSSWKQHNVTTFGHTQINELLTEWVALVGRSNVDVVSEVKDDCMHLITLKLTPLKTEASFLINLWVNHNDTVIKRVNCIVDTIQMTKAVGKSITQVSEIFPDPDPLHIPDLDHQDHLQNCHAIPSMLIDSTRINTDLLDKWWSIWTWGKLQGISQYYSDDAYLYHPQEGENCSADSLFNMVAGLRNLFVRKLYQLEHISVENNRVAIRWYLEGDERLSKKRVRIYCCSILEISSDQISKDILIFDTVAQLKKQSESSLFNFVT